MRHRTLLLLALLSLCIAPLASAKDDDGPPPLSSLYRKIARLEVAIEEISGMTALPTSEGSERHFLTVSDEGAYHAASNTVKGSLFRLRLEVSDDDVTVAGVDAITLDIEAAIPRLDPLWAQVGGQPDLESCVPLPGAANLYLIGGERNPQDVSDGGANRLYVVRYPAGSDTRAELLSYLRLPDLPDDTINDRFEAVVAVATEQEGTWMVCAMKERTYSPDRVPRYFPALLKRIPNPNPGPGTDIAFTLRPVKPRALLEDPERLSSQADACLAPNGAVWVLDRWRREIHLAKPITTGSIGLEYDESLDYFDVVEGIPGEHGKIALPGERRAPGGRRAGYGRHEAICFDAKGSLYLAADLGGGRPSTVTVLVPK